MDGAPDEYNDGGNSENHESESYDDDGQDDDALGPLQEYFFDRAIIDYMNGVYNEHNILSNAVAAQDGFGNNAHGNQDLDARMGIALRNLKLDLDENVRMMGRPSRLPTCLNYITIQPTTEHVPSFMNFGDEDLELPHEESSSQHWEKFAIALRECNERFHTIDLLRVHLTANIVEMLTPALAVQNLRELSFNHNQLGRDGILMLVKFLECNSSLYRLDLSGNVIDDLGVATELSRAVREHLHLESFVLHKTGVGGREDILSVLLLSNINSIFLGCNNIGTPGAKVITKFIESNPPTKWISIDENKFTDDDVPLFVNALKKNTNLVHLNLLKNELSESGMKAVIKTALDPSTMKTLHECNHTCKFVLSTTDNAIQNVNMSDSPARNRRKKIHLALRVSENDGSFNERHFHAVPIEVMPHAIDMLQQDRKEFLMLTKLYQLIKGWKIQSVLASKEGNYVKPQNNNISG